MNMKNTMINRSKRAFTLIEMLVVIVIISILAALIIPNVLKHAAQAKIAAAKSDISTLSDSLQRYHLDNDVYPSTEEGLNALVSAPSDAKNWKGPYLTKNTVPNDPWGNAYQYQSPGPSGEDFYIESYGPTGQPGGTGDNAPITSDDSN
jgi:general secretion pathway protein G